ncbi:MAG: anaerobic ribonucleoside-triphosphate reductase activating protein [Oscillospiraceae bacterium]|nr:anaerobic ribonucleoside-triphosphate reductase activating protein [Oscillospiraceae bacterium]
MSLKIAGTVNDSIVDGPGFRFTVFVQGCPHRCKGCHNPQTHDFDGGRYIESEEIISKVKSNPLLDGVTFSGGEPFCQAEELSKLASEIKKLGMNIITYTGYDFEYLYENRSKNGFGKLLEVTDILIDGKFIEELKDWKIKFRGSSNQRFLDCKNSLDGGYAVEINL